VTIQMKVIEQYFPVATPTTLMVLTSEYVVKILKSKQ